LLAKALVFFKMASLSDLVKASLPIITIGNLAFWTCSHNSWVPLKSSLITWAVFPKCSYS
jgi:hypothetical protein